MTTLDDYLLEDLVDDHLANHVMTLRAAALRAEYKNTETITATKELTDNDTPFQLITASGANRTVELAPEATTNHATVIYNNGGSNDVVVKDDSGTTTFATLNPGEWCMALPIGGVVWKVIDSNAFSGYSAVSSGAGAPGSTPAAVGNIYVDTTNLIIYVATGTSSSSDWKAQVGIATTQTLTNKRITPRVTSETSSATPTINTDNSDIHRITALAAAITSFTTNLSGTPTHGQKLIIEITDNGTARAITWGASFASTTVTLPTTTVISKLLRVGFLWDSADSTWDCVAVSQEA